MNGRDVWHRLFFTSFDRDTMELDIGWLLLLIAFVNGIIIFDLSALGIVDVSLAAWSWYGSLTAMVFIAGTTIAKARLLASKPDRANPPEPENGSTDEPSI
jgi:hypothetical protein